MENSTGFMNGFSWDGIIGLLIIAGIFGYGNGFGFGGNNARADITNEFLYNQLANDVRANGAAITGVDRDVLTTSCNTDKEIMQNRYDNAIQTQTLSAQASTNQLSMQNQLSSCCCELKGLVRDEVQSLKDLINNNTIQELRDTKQGYELVSALGNSVNTITNRFGTFYPNPPYSPYYPYYGNGTTIL